MAGLFLYPFSHITKEYYLCVSLKAAFFCNLTVIKQYNYLPFFFDK
jgi:hypothetical protein